jgi:uncharacterized protein
VSIVAPIPNESRCIYLKKQGVSTLESTHFVSSLHESLQSKLHALEEILKPHNRLAVAYSGGADSTFLVWLAQHILQKDMVAILAVGPFLSARERTSAFDVAQRLAFHLEVIAIDPLANSSVLENSEQRCYHCKKEIMMSLTARAKDLGCSLVVDGSHAGDLEQHRPGSAALREMGVVSPLALAQFNKSEIREISRAAQLPTWNKFSQSCLATRFPYGTSLTQELISAVERAEDILWDLGCKQVRVRVHGRLARIEVDPDSFPLLTERGAREIIVHDFQKLGFDFVSLDLAGFRSGSWDGAI